MTSTMPTVAQLRAFVAVADYLHVSAAAASLRVSQPTLSQNLAALEEVLGVQLIERSPRRVLVTPAGRRLLPLARQAVEAVEAVADAATPDRLWLSGPLRLGVIPTVAPYLLPAVLRSFETEAPDLEPIVREDQTFRLLDALRLGDVDVALLALPMGEPTLAEIPVYEEDFVVLTPLDHEWAGRQDVERYELSGAPLLLLDEGHCLRDQVLDVCHSAGVSTVTGAATRATSLATIVQLVAAGVGVTLLPETALPVESARGGVAVARFAGGAPGRTIGLVCRHTTGRRDEFEDLAEIVRRSVASLPARSVGGL